MSSKNQAEHASSALSVSIGERVTVGDSDAEFVVMSVDHVTGRLELLQLKPGRIESDVPASSIRRKAGNGPQLVPVARE